MFKKAETVISRQIGETLNFVNLKVSADMEQAPRCWEVENLKYIINSRIYPNPSLTWFVYVPVLQ